MAIKLGGGGGGGGLPVNIVLGYSQTWVPPVDGNICIHVVGAGGGGRGQTNAARLSAGAGGYCKHNSLAVTTSGSFTVVVGAGGAGSYNAGVGGNGGNTTVSGTGLSSTLTANGGTGADAAYPDSPGGTASGGDVNNTGGAGGSYGGGAVGITGTGNSGSVTNAWRGGSCDVVGPESLMGHGYICGGIGGDTLETYTTNSQYYGPTTHSPNGNGGFLAGGGTVHMRISGSSARLHGGHGGIGGGGGGGRNEYSSNTSYGGSGGNGIVIIQYLPA
jgi:hypothetical protein